MNTTTPQNAWYPADTGNHQGLIICETTGANIAVCYDKAHAPLIAAAPQMLAALRHILNEWCEGGALDGTDAERAIIAAIQAAEGES